MPIPFLFGGGGSASIINSAPGIVARFDATTGITSSGGFASQWSDLSGNARHLLQATGANQPHHLPAGVNLTGTCQAGSTGTTIVLPVAALAVNDIYNDMTVAITAGTGSGQSKTITDYVGATKTATVSAWSVTPDDTSVVSVTASRPSLFFNGEAHFMRCAAFTLNQPETVYLVVKQVSWTNNDYLFDGSTVGTMSLSQQLASPNLQLSAGGVLQSDPDLAIGTSGVVCGVFNGADGQLQINLNTPTTADIGALNAGGFTLARPGDVASAYSNIQAYEALIYNVAHSAAQRTSVIAALMSKWGVA